LAIAKGKPISKNTFLQAAVPISKMSNPIKDGPWELPNYHYEILQTATSIRLLNLEIGSSDDDYGRLETFRLEAAPPFAALSYTWGNPYAEPNYELEDVSQGAEYSRKYTPERNCSIRCHETKVMVTHNLVDALDNIKRRYMPQGWSPGSTPYIWIDAICINQEDLQERGAQVAIMDRIYASAQRVFVWLGSSLPKTEKALELIKYLATIPEEKYDIMKDHDPKLVWETYKALDMEKITPDDWLILLSFLERNWFHRVWMIQEYCLPRYSTVLCGLDRIPWMDIYLVSRMLKVTNWCHQLLHLEEWRDALMVKDSIRQVANTSETSRSTVQTSATPFNSSSFDRAMDRLLESHSPASGTVPGLGPFALTSMRQHLWPSTPDQKTDSSLSVGVQMARGMGATDARDRVYALLGGINLLLSRTAGIQPIVPSYDTTNTVEKVFAEFTIRTIQAENSLGVLSYINDETLRKIAGLPSWALDLTMSMNPHKMLAEYFSHASGDIGFEAPTFTGLAYLHTRGYCLDEIVNSVIPYSSVDSGHVVGWLELVLELPIPYYTGEGMTEVLWRTLLTNANQVQQEYPAPASCGNHFCHYLFARLLMPRNANEMNVSNQERIDWLLQGSQLLVKLKKIDPDGAILDVDQLNRIYLACQGGQNQESQMKEVVYPIIEAGWNFEPFIAAYSFYRRLFLTRKKYLGLGSQSLRHGDELWALPGLNAPAILRRQSNGHFTLVGSAYVHGIMNGEGLSSETRLEAITLE
jgi:hypothetical protein